jgi:O-antigen/teichoic acid export membrane protein
MRSIPFYLVGLFQGFGGIILSILVISNLELAEFGLYSGIISTISLVAAFSQIGLSNTLIKNYNTFTKEEKRNYLSNSIFATVLLSTFFSIFLTFVSSHGALFNILIFLICIFQNLNLYAFNGLFQAEGLQRRLSAFLFLMLTSKLVFFSLALKFMPSVLSLILCLSVIEAVALCFVLASFRNVSARWVSIKIFRENFGELFKFTFSKYFDILSMPAFVVFTVAIFKDAEFVAQVAFCCVYSRLLVNSLLPSQRFESFLTSEYLKEKLDPKSLKAFSDFIVIGSFFVGACILASFLVFGLSVEKSLFNGQYDDTLGFFFFSLIFMIVGSFSNFFSPQLYKEGKVIIFSYSSLLGALSCCALVSVGLIGASDIFLFLACGIASLIKLCFLMAVCRNSILPFARRYWRSVSFATTFIMFALLAGPQSLSIKNGFYFLFFVAIGFVIVIADLGVRNIVRMYSKV